MVIVGFIGIVKFCGVFGFVGIVIVRLIGCWVLDIRGVKGVVLDGVIVVIVFWVGFIVFLIFKSKIFFLIYIKMFFFVVICCIIIKIKKFFKFLKIDIVY